MSGVITAIAAVGVGTAVYNNSVSSKATKAAQARLDGLQYVEDPDYRESQDALKELGLGLVKGEVPDYYKSIGESGGTEFENMLALLNKDITNSAQETMASKGMARGGSIGAVTADAVASNSTKLRYADYARSLTGKEALLNKGISVTEGVRTAGANQGTAVNKFNVDKTGAEIGLINQKANADMEMASSIGSSVKGAIGGLSDKSFLDQLFGSKTPATTAAETTAKTGVSSLGSIRSGITDEDLSTLFANLK